MVGSIYEQSAGRCDLSHGPGIRVDLEELCDISYGFRHSNR